MPGGEVGKGMLQPRNTSASCTLLIMGGKLQGPGQCSVVVLLCRSSALSFLPPLRLPFSINVFHHMAIYVRATFGGLKNKP